MSTKTTFKRIALVAVAALGFGVLTAVAPATAGQIAPSTISFGTASNLRAGVAGSVTVTFALPAGTAVGDTFTVLARVTSAPATSFATAKAAVPGASAISSTAASASNGIWWSKASTGSGSYGTIGTDSDGTSDDGNNLYNSVGTGSDGVNDWTTVGGYKLATGDSTTSVSLRLNFQPDASGSYNILVVLGTAANASYDVASELNGATSSNLTTNLTSSVGTFATGSTPTTATLAAVTTGAPEDGTTGALWKITLDGALGTSETIKLTSNSSTVTFKKHNGTTLTNATLTSADFSAGVGYFTVQNTAAETATITATGTGLLSSSVTATGTVTHVAPTVTLTDDTVISLTTATTAMAGTDTAGTNTATALFYAARTSSTSQSIKVTGEPEEIFTALVTDTNGKATGKGGATYEKTGTFAATLGTATFSVPATLAAGESLTIAIDGITTTITGRASTPTTVTITNPSRRAALLSTNAFVATVKDQYGSVMAGQTVTASVAGRNATTSAASYTSDALGQVTHSVTDAGTTGLSDTVTFTTSTGSKTASATVSYGSATASTVTLVGPNTDDTVISLADKTDINASSSGANATTATITATIKDAGANVMSGMPVTFTVTGTNCAITSTQALKYTGAAGTATTTVYKWTNGSCVVSATSGGVTSTDTVHFAQKTATEARTIAAVAAGNVVTGTVSDRFGNPVPGVTVWASRVGTGAFGGASSASAVTAEDGTVQFILTEGTADVKLALGSTAGADVEYGQSSSSAGKICDGSGCTDTALTAATVGTATTAETYVGSSIAPAGVNSATVKAVSDTATLDQAQAATDAAAEATDAANAATDAANAAAEAADAATAAAQDAADAVAALSTQVSEMVNALKKQITALTNLVIKIQKKVRA
jgi:hypothetical protein